MSKYFLPFDDIADLNKRAKSITDAQRDYIREIKREIRKQKIDHINMGEFEIKVDEKGAAIMDKISNDGVVKAFLNAGVKKVI